MHTGNVLLLYYYYTTTTAIRTILLYYPIYIQLLLLLLFNTTTAIRTIRTRYLLAINTILLRTRTYWAEHRDSLFIVFVLPKIGTPTHIDPFIGTLRNAHQKRLTCY